jgi:hypothetical protein
MDQSLVVSPEKGLDQRPHLVRARVTQVLPCAEDSVDCHPELPDTIYRMRHAADEHGGTGTLWAAHPCRLQHRTQLSVERPGKARVSRRL